MNRLLATALIAGSGILLPVGNAFALPNLVLSNSFTPVESGRTYMDIGGTWNGTGEVANGDGFTLSVTNASLGPTPLDDAYDIRDIPVTVPAGFVLASPTVTVTDAGGGCPNMSASASQAGGAGANVTINIASNGSTVIRPGCTYNYTFRLETNTSAVAGSPSLGYTVTYNTVDEIMRDLKAIGASVTAGTVEQGRAARGLGGKSILQTVRQAYEQFRREDLLPASYEIIYGHAWKPQAVDVENHSTKTQHVKFKV